ncbi:HTTM domain-containing protein [Catenulispora yoronensis]
MRRLLESAARFDPRTPVFATARSLLAFAQLCGILFTPDRDLILAVPHPDLPGPCGGINGISMWCVTGGDSTPNPSARMVAVAVLTAVMIGVKPRWLCIPHWYIAFSVSTSVTIADGAASISEIVCELLIPQGLGDTRRTHWGRSRVPLAPHWRGSAYAAHLVLRAQVAIVYLSAAIMKMQHSAWRRGQALRIIMQDPQFGAPGLVRPAVDSLLRHGWLSSAAMWSTLAIEVGIGTAMLGGASARRYALGATIVLHLFIMTLMGLFGFALVMMATVAFASTTTPLRKAATSADRVQPVRSVVRR